MKSMIASAVLAALLLSGPASAQEPPDPVIPPPPGCTRDIECKGVRICEEGRCVYPPEEPEPAIPEETEEVAPLLPFREPEPIEPARYYLSVGLSLISVEILASEGDRPDNARLSLIPTNFRLAGYSVLMPGVQLGGFFRYKYLGMGDSDVNGYHAVLLGASGRFGFAMGRDGIIGLNLDLGLSVYRNAEAYVGLGSAGKPNIRRTDDFSFYLFPAIVYSTLFGNKNVRGGIEVMLGIDIYAGDQASLDDGDYQHVTLGPSLHIGFTIGGP